MIMQLQDNGVKILRPPRDGYMAFIRSPDEISIELLQIGTPLPPQEPWLLCQVQEPGNQLTKSIDIPLIKTFELLSNIREQRTNLVMFYD